MDLSNDTTLPPAQATTACALFGLCFAFLFYGIMLCQGYTYFRTYRADPLDLKLTVAAILLANTTNLGLFLHTCYYYAVTHYATPSAFAHISSSLLPTPICIFLCIVLCDYVYIRQAYFIIRWKAGWVFVPLVILFVSTAAAFIIVLTVKIAQRPTFQQWLEFKWLVPASFGCSVLGDLGLACILSVAFKRVSRTGKKRTDATLNSMANNALASGVVTSMLSILSLLIASLEGKNVFIIPASLAVAKVYANATLTTLNTRYHMNRGLTAPGGSGLLSLDVLRYVPQESARREGQVQVLGHTASTFNNEV